VPPKLQSQQGSTNRVENHTFCQSAHILTAQTVLKILTLMVWRAAPRCMAAWLRCRPVRPCNFVCTMPERGKLCHAMRLPAIRIDGLQSNLENLLEHCLYLDVIDSYLVRRKELLEQYLALFDQENLKIVPLLRTVYAAPRLR
jgi:hypothetical protein